jgi:hypothetical protein
VTRRQHSRFAQALLVIAGLAIAGASPTAVSAAGAVSIPELMAAKKKGEWSAYAQSGASMKIEGRQAVFRLVQGGRAVPRRPRQPAWPQSGGVWPFRDAVEQANLRGTTIAHAPFG